MNRGEGTSDTSRYLPSATSDTLGNGPPVVLEMCVSIWVSPGPGSETGELALGFSPSATPRAPPQSLFPTMTSSAHLHQDQSPGNDQAATGPRAWKGSEDTTESCSARAWNPKAPGFTSCLARLPGSGKSLACCTHFLGLV